MSCPWLAPRFPPGYHCALPWLRVFFLASSVKVVSFLIAFALSPVNSALPDQKALPVVFEESAANSCTWKKVRGRPWSPRGRIVFKVRWWPRMGEMRPQPPAGLSQAGSPKSHSFLHSLGSPHCGNASVKGKNSVLNTSPLCIIPYHVWILLDLVFLLFETILTYTREWNC